jgi:hypothetical protein
MSAKNEKYTSMKAMKKHETTEGSSARKKEYGSAKGGMHAMNGKMMKNSDMKKSGVKKPFKKMGKKK